MSPRRRFAPNWRTTRPRTAGYRGQVRQLEAKLSQVLGAAVLDELPLDDHREVSNEARLQQRVEQLESEAFELREALADRQEQLEAVRTINRELVAQQNRA